MRCATVWCLVTVAAAMNSTDSYVEMESGAIPADESLAKSHDLVAKYYGGKTIFFAGCSVAGKCGGFGIGTIASWGAKVANRMEGWLRGGRDKTFKALFNARVNRVRAEDGAWYNKIYNINAFAWFLDHTLKLGHKEGSCWIANKLMNGLGRTGAEGVHAAAEWGTEMFTDSAASAAENDIPAVKEIKMITNAYFGFQHNSRHKQLCGTCPDEMEIPEEDTEAPSSPDYCHGTDLSRKPTGLGTFGQKIVEGIDWLESKYHSLPVQIPAANLLI